MIIKIRKVKHIRSRRRCNSCDKWMNAGDEAIYLYGMPFYGDKPQSNWVHFACGYTSTEVRKKLAKLEVKK